VRSPCPVRFDREPVIDSLSPRRRESFASLILELKADQDGKTLNHLFGIERPVSQRRQGRTSQEIEYDRDATIHTNEHDGGGRRRIMAGAGVISELSCPSQTAQQSGNVVFDLVQTMLLVRGADLVFGGSGAATVASVYGRRLFSTL
jgi:hypothetical protein